MAFDLAAALDPSLLFRDVGFVPDPWQEQALRDQSDRLLLLCARQLGKSTVTSCVATHQAIYKPGSLTLLFAPSLRQSTLLFSKVMKVYQWLDRPIPAIKELALSLELENGSRIVTLPGDEETTRGFSAVDLAIIDESARTSDALLVAVLPMLAVSKGRLIALSTPFGRRGWFHEQWTGTGSDWTRIIARATDCPRVDPRFLEEQRRLLGPRWYAQEFECSFEETIGQFFSTESILAAFDSDEPPLFAQRGAYANV